MPLMTKEAYLKARGWCEEKAGFTKSDNTPATLFVDPENPVRCTELERALVVQHARDAVEMRRSMSEMYARLRAAGLNDDQAHIKTAEFYRWWQSMFGVYFEEKK